MGFYEVTAEAGLPVAINLDGAWMLHSAPGAVVELDDAAAAELGVALRRLDAPAATPELNPVEFVHEPSPAEPEQPAEGADTPAEDEPGEKPTRSRRRTADG